MNTYEQMMNTIDKQEAMLRVKKFSPDDGLDLGNFLIKRAKQQGITVSVGIRKPSGALLFHHCMEGTNLNNQNWMRRKFNAVMLWEHSSLRAFAHEQISGETIETHGFAKTDYIQMGGGFPIFLESGELVAVLTISNLPHVQDHNFAVGGLAEWLGVDNIPMVEE